MRYAEKWTKVDIENMNLEKVLLWCAENIKGKQFIEGKLLKFELKGDADLFKLSYKE